MTAITSIVTLKEQVKEGKVERAGPACVRNRHERAFTDTGLWVCLTPVWRSSAGTARENMHRGVDVLKIFVTPGAPAPTPESFIPCFLSYDEISTVVEEAHRMGIRTAAHCIGGLGLDYCVKAGVDVIEHVYSITPEQVKMVEEAERLDRHDVGNCAGRRARAVSSGFAGSEDAKRERIFPPVLKSCLPEREDPL